MLYKNRNFFRTKILSHSKLISTLVITEHDNKKESPITRNALTASKQIGGDITILVAGENCRSVSETLSKINGVSKILEACNKNFKDLMVENLTLLLLHLQKQNKYTHIVGGSSCFSRSLLPRLAAKLDVSPITDVTRIITPDTFARCIYSGSGIQTIKCKDPVTVLTVRGVSFDEDKSTGGSAKIEELPETNFVFDPVEIVARNLLKYKRPQLQTAKVVVSGGRGLQKRDNFKLVYDLADKLCAAVGSTRAVVDAGFVPSDYQIGQTGKIVAPEMYVAIGISGAVQHTIGMRDSKVIVAINKDSSAPIFKIATYGIVGDLFKIVPELINKL